MLAPCPSCQNLVDLATAPHCPHCGWRFNSSGSTGLSLVKPAVRPKIQVEIDLAISVDRTGSSEPFRVGIPMTLDVILKQVSAKARCVRCWLQSHGDLDEGQQPILHTDGGTVDQAAEDIKKISYGGGGDPPEHHLDAVEHLLKIIPFTADPNRARGAILAFMTADTKPTRSGVSARQLGDDIKKRAILLYLVCEPTPTLKDLVDAANGMMFQITNSPDPNELQQIACGLGGSILASVARGGTVPMIA